MTVGVQAFSGERLREARLARGLYKNALADMVGVSSMSITHYESGSDKPQHERLVSLSECLAFPYQFFLQPCWVEPIENVFWRSRSAETKYAREMTEQRMTWLCEVFAYLEREVDFPPFALPNLRVPEDFRGITGELIEGYAEGLRHAWGLHHHPVPDMLLALENIGIPVVNMHITSDKQDGFCFRSAALGRIFVGINTSLISAARARYDAAHELGHAVMHAHVQPQQARDPAFHKLLEQQAHRFAGAFLFPRKAFYDEVRRPTLDYFCSLKKRWGISIAAMVHRAFDLEMVNSEEMTALYRNMGRRRWKGAHKEPFDDPGEMPLEKPRMMRRAMMVILDQGVMRRHHIQAALCLPDLELEQILGVEAGFFRGNSIEQLAVPKRKPLTATDLETGSVIEFRRRHER